MSLSLILLSTGAAGAGPGAATGGAAPPTSSARRFRFLCGAADDGSGCGGAGGTTEGETPAWESRLLSLSLSFRLMV